MARLVSPTQEKMDMLLVYLARKIGEHKPRNVVFFIVDILCTYYPQHIPTFSKIWLMDKTLDEQKQYVRDLFRRNNSTSCIAQHFINAGFDSLDVLTTLNTDILDEIQAYNNTTWLPGHKIRIYQIFRDIKKLVKEYKDEIKAERMVYYGDGPIYKQIGGPYIASNSATTLKVDRSNAMMHPSPTYYYPKVHAFPSVGAKTHKVYNIPSTIHTSKPEIRSTEGVYLGNAVTMTRLSNISAEAVTNKVIDDLIAKANSEGIETTVASSNSCCYLPSKK